MTYLKTVEKTKIIKKVVGEIFGKGNVRCRRGRGTASHWIETDVYTPHVCADSTCRERSYATNQDCIDRATEIERGVAALARSALKSAGGEMSTFSSDDGYGTNLDCHSIRVILTK